MRPSRFRPRFTLRWMMIAVAIMAFALGLKVRRDGFLRQASRWDIFVLMRVHSVGSSGTRYFDAANVEKAKNLQDKYERAARYPWLPVAPDPPDSPKPEFLDNAEFPD